MHPNLIHPHPSPHPHHHPHQLIPPIHHLNTPPTTNPIGLKRTKVQSPQEDDEETLAKKKKNADAQAAFRLRRQTYIKSLEDTVTELQNAVKEMELLVKTSNHEVKVKCEQVAYLESKLKQGRTKTDETSDDHEPVDLNSSTLPNSHHCPCCRFAPSSPTTFDHPDQKVVINRHDHLNNPSTTSLTDQSTPDPSHDRPTPSTDWSNPTTVSHHPHRPTSYPALLLPTQTSHPTTHGHQSPKSDYNRILHRHQTNEHEAVSPNTATSASFSVFFDPHFAPALPHHTSTSAAGPYYSSIDPTHSHHPNSLMITTCSPNLPSSSTYDRSSPTTPHHHHQLNLHHPTPRSWSSATYTSSPKLYSPMHDRFLGPTAHHTYGLAEEQKRRREEESAGMMSSGSNGFHLNSKLNGLPAKVARCEQTVLEVSKVVSQAKEQAKLAAAASSGMIDPQRQQQQKRIQRLKFEQQQQAFSTDLV